MSNIEKTFDARDHRARDIPAVPAGFPGYPAPTDPLVRIAVALEQIAKLLNDKCNPF